MYVYKITNKINDKLYIGITACSLEKRWREHKCAARSGLDTPLYKAMRKHGIDQFQIVLLYEGVDRLEIQAVEKGLIAQYGSYVRSGGYNLTLGGEGEGKVVRKIGEESHNAKLTEEMVAFIRSPSLWNKSNRELLEMLEEAFGQKINVDTIKAARQGKCWKHLDAQHPPILVKQGSRKLPLSNERRQQTKEMFDRLRAVTIAAQKLAVQGKRSKNAKLSEETVKEIFYSNLSLAQTAKAHSVSKKMVLLIKKRKAHVYLTKDL
jgi:group I intron endonuclease